MTVSLDDQIGYGIGAVSRLTGIPLDTLRVWGRRYALVNPIRTPDNKRLYSPEDVAKLKLVKKLVDQGHVISAVANLSEAALVELMQSHLTRPESLPPETRWRAMAYGDALPFFLQQWKQEGLLTYLDLLGSYRAFADFEQAALDQMPNTVIMEMSVLNRDRLAQIRGLLLRIAPLRAVVVYTFGAKSIQYELEKLGIFMLRSPVTARHLEQCYGMAVGNQTSNQTVIQALPDSSWEIPSRRFDSEILANLVNITSKIQCECPQHLADLLFRLNAFEAYSADCENRNQQDALLHEHLHQATAKARLILEDALDYLIQSEEIELGRPTV